jgi:hypothetical protein
MAMGAQLPFDLSAMGAVKSGNLDSNFDKVAETFVAVLDLGSENPGDEVVTLYKTDRDLALNGEFYNLDDAALATVKGAQWTKMGDFSTAAYRVPTPAGEKPAMIAELPAAVHGCDVRLSNGREQKPFDGKADDFGVGFVFDIPGLDYVFGLFGGKK